jgi:hypothetical protein
MGTLVKKSHGFLFHGQNELYLDENSQQSRSRVSAASSAREEKQNSLQYRTRRT